MTELYFLEGHTRHTSNLNYIFVKEVALLCGLASNNLFQILELLVSLLKLYITEVSRIQLDSELKVIQSAHSRQLFLKSYNDLACTVQLSLGRLLRSI